MRYQKLINFLIMIHQIVSNVVI